MTTKVLHVGRDNTWQVNSELENGWVIIDMAATNDFVAYVLKKVDVKAPAHIDVMSAMTERRIRGTD
jgi:hypothetical protein